MEDSNKRPRIDGSFDMDDDDIDHLIPNVTTSPLRNESPTIRDEATSENTIEDASTVDYNQCPDLVPFHEIEPRRVDIVKDAIRDIYGFESPRNFQIESIHHLCFNDDSELVLIRRTADGKSLVPLTTAVIRGGVTLVLVPLHGLGSDQVEKAVIPQHGVESYYVDEHKYGNARTLERRLNAYSEEEADHNSIIIFCSPNALKDDCRWFEIFSNLASKNLIRTMGIDEAHEVEQSGRSFRTEFVDAVKSMKRLHAMSPSPIPRIIMTATLRSSDYNTVATYFGLSDPVFLVGDLARRNTMFSFFISGDPGKTLLKHGLAHLKSQPDKQQLWYANSRTACEGNLLDKAEIMIEKHLHPDGIMSTAQSFTGGDGIKKKTALMDAFTSFADLPGQPIFHANKSVTLPKISIMTATSSANCGVSSNSLTNVKHKGFPFDLYSVVQEMGRANRTQRMTGCSFEIHASFDCLLSTYVRIMTNKSSVERERMTKNLMEVVRFLVLPDECYHSFVEHYFEWGNNDDKAPCENMCSYCCGHTDKLTGVFYREQVVGVLTKLFRNDVSVSASDLKKAFKKDKDKIFHTKYKIKQKMAPIHALLLQIICAGLLKMSIGDKEKVGNDKIKNADVVFRLTTSVNKKGIEVFAYTVKELWEGMTCI